MPTVGTGVRNLLDVAKGLDPDGRVAKVVELLTISNEIMLDMTFNEGNTITGNQTTVRTALPAVTWRLLNNGVVPSKSTKAQIMEQCGILEAWSEIDCAVANIGGDPGAARLSEAKSFLEAMSQGFASTLFYGTAATPEQFVGLSPRYGTITGAGNAQQIISGGGSASDNTSIWLIGWSNDTVTGIYPKGSVAGLQHKDLGEQTITVTTGIGGTRMRAYQDQFIWNAGLAVKDYRYVVRIPNIDVSNLVAESTPTDLTNKMMRAVARIPSMAGIRPAFYMNRTVYEMLGIQRREAVQSGGQLRYEVVDGQYIPSFMGIPIRRCDSLLLTETAVS